MNEKENKMGIAPIKVLLISMSLPMMLSMLIQAGYNIVDSIFVSRVSEDALTAVSLAFPIQNILIALATGVGVGINSVLSKSLGEKNFKKVNRCAGNSLLLTLVNYVVFLVLGLLFVPPFYRMQTNSPVILKYGIEYGLIVCILSFGVLVQVTCERLLQSTGKTVYVMIVQGTGAVINMIFDPIFIFGMFGFPRMEVAGAALATVMGQICAGLLGIFINLRHNREIQFSVRYLRPDKNVIGQIYAVGVPSIIMISIGSVMVYGLNKILMVFSTTAVAVFGVYFKLQSFVLMPLFGLNNGVIPIIAYNYGAGNRKRVIQAIRTSAVYALIIMLSGLAVMQIFPRQLLLLFDASENMMSIGIPALRTISLSFVFAGICIACGCAFQALGKGVYSMVVSIVRQLVVLLPAAYALSLLGNVDYVWFAFLFAELFSVAVTAYYMTRMYKGVICRI